VAPEVIWRGKPTSSIVLYRARGSEAAAATNSKREASFGGRVAANQIFMENMQASLLEEVCKTKELESSEKRTSSLNRSPAPSPSKQPASVLVELPTFVESESLKE
jgi:hypothetical protein